MEKKEEKYCINCGCILIPENTTWHTDGIDVCDTCYELACVYD